jgi:hypothetical protein
LIDKPDKTCYYEATNYHLGGENSMSNQLFALMLTVFVIGLFVGSNLGVLLMCLLHIAGTERSVKPEMTGMAVQLKE